MSVKTPPKDPMNPAKPEDIAPLEKAPGSRDLELERWWKLVEAFRGQTPVNYSEAAKTVGVQVNTARVAFISGNKKLNRPAIRDILLLEARAARTEAERKYEKIAGSPAERLSANRDATAVRALEGKLVHGVGLATEILLSSLLTLLKNVQPITLRLATELASLGTAPGAADKKELWKTLRELKEMTKDVGSLVRQKMELERLLMGDPKALETVTSDISVADAIREVDAAAKILRRLSEEPIAESIQNELAASGIKLKLIKGGKPDDEQRVKGA